MLDLRPFTARWRQAGRAVAAGLLAASAAGCRVGPDRLLEAGCVPVEDACLALEMHGPDRAGPVLLMLHGGPGGAERPLQRLFNGDLEEDFAVAYWDQRGAGRSFDQNADPQRLTVATHLADLDAVVDHVRGRNPGNPLILVGHSWGAALGLLYAARHPAKVDGVIAVAPLVDGLEQQRSEWAYVRARALAAGDRSALSTLDRIGPPPLDARGLLDLARLDAAFGGVSLHPPGHAWTAIRALALGLVTPGEIVHLIRGNDVSLAAMARELADLDLSRSAPEVAVPVAFMLGRGDRHAEARVAARYAESLVAPSKAVLWFDAGHDIPYEVPQAYRTAVVETVRHFLSQAPR